MKRDNRGVLIVAVLIATMLLTFAFAACETECEHENCQHFEAVEATCVKDGNIEYWYCPDCGVYLDSQNSVRTQEELVMKATGEHEFEDGVCLVCGAKSEEGLSFRLNDDEASYTVKGIGSATSNNLVIPVTHNGLPVTRISDNAFSGCSDLTSVTIPDSVTGIGSGAFYGCSGLTTIVIPDSVVSIGSSAFRNCSGLTSVKIPFVGEKADGSGSTDFDYIFGGTALDSLKEVVVTGGESIGEYAFHNCHSLTSVTIEDDVTSIGNGAFYGCNSLTKITIPFVGANLEGNVETNFGYVFGAQNYLDNADYFPASLKEVIVTGGTSIGEHAFFDFSSLTSVTIPDSVTSIGNDAFYGCSDLTSITIPDSVTSIGSYAFYGCSDLTGITLPDSVTSFGDWAFSLCYGLKSFTIPNRMINIGSYAFFGCSSLTSITIPDSVTNIGDHAFNYCTNLTSITIPFVGTNADGIGATHFGYIFGASNYSSNDSYVPSSLKEVIITGGESIGSHAFDGCSGLTSITIPDSVTSIGSYASYGCSGLTSITIPDSVTDIGDYAFYGCSGLTSVTIPDSVIGIGGGAFSGCSGLTSISIPFVGANANGTGSTRFGHLFDNNDNVPDSLKEVIITGGESIADNAFEGCTSLTTVTIPETVTTLGDNVFADGTSLEKIIFNGTIEQWRALESNSSGNDKLIVECTDGRYRFFVTYDLDGGVNAASNPSSYTMDTLGGADGSIALADPNKKGEVSGYTANDDGAIKVTQNVYTFLGWYKDASFEQKVTSLTFDLGDVTLYAKWSEQSNEVQTEVKQYLRVAENNEVDAQGEYILFGWYPQTIKSSDVTVGDVADEDGYYLGSDGERYAKVVADPYGSGYTFSDGSAVTEGNTYYFKVELIRWRILNESDGSAFIMADGIIANSRYAPNYNDYADSDIRAWLNGEFLNTAFGEVAQGLIETTEVDNSEYSTGYSSNPYACENTFDKVFLLSYREVVNSDYGFASSTARQMTVNDYARSTGAYMNTSNSYFGCGRWWLRSPVNADVLSALRVSSNAHIDYYDVSSGYHGVVPAMNIKL